MQAEFDIRCEWGAQGVAQLAPISDVIIIVDVLSFSTCVDIATNQGALVFPYCKNDVSAAQFAAAIDAELAAHKRTPSKFSLSPHSLLTIPAGTRLVLPSPNGSTLTLNAGTTPTLAGCLRNAHAVAQAALQIGQRIAVIPAGERWRTDGSLRPAFEDWVGAGAIISHLAGVHSPEARLAATAFQSVSDHLLESLQRCSSGKELIERGFAEDVRLAAKLDVSSNVPRLINGAYIKIHI